MNPLHRPPFTTAIVTLVGVLALAHCTGSSTPSRSNQNEETRPQTPPENSDASVTSDAGSADGGDIDGSIQSKSSPRGIRGKVLVLEGSPGGRIIAAVPGSTKAIATATIDGEGRFKLNGLEPQTYRLILPADGVHSTADLYTKLAPDAGIADIEIPRSRGCAVTIKVRAHDNHLISGARLDFGLTDLPHVEEPHRVQAETDENGQLVVQGSCVRGFYEGTLTTPDGRSYPFRHGYVGTGRDKFDIVLPGPDEADAGVAYTNDD